MNSDEILKTAKKRYKEGLEAWSEFFAKAREVNTFVNGDQWDNQLKRSRTDAGLPTLQSNQIPTFLRSLTNEARTQTPSIQITPSDDNATPETAEVISDLVRGIEHASNADTAYDTASMCAATTGLGFIRVLSEYAGTDSFEQNLCIAPVLDAETVVIDPNHKLPDGSDAKWCFITSSLTEDEYKSQFPTTDLASKLATKGWSVVGLTDWIKPDEIVIAEYYWIDEQPATLYQVFNNITLETIISTVTPDEDLINNGTLVILQKRPTTIPVIQWCKLNDCEILEQTVWPGSCLPIITVKGDETWINGRRFLKGAVADAMDSQRVLNYFFSIQAELVSLAPKAPFIGEIRQFANFEHLWRDSNVAPSAYLPYNAVVDHGVALPPPQRSNNAPDIQAAMAMCAQARDNLKSIFGIFDASLGAEGNETSGKAILARTAQSHNSTYHFYDNLAKSIQQVGKVLVECIPSYYSQDRIVQLVKRSGEASTLRINGGDSQHDLGIGKYGVVVETGASFSTRRQDSVTHMITLGQAYPQAMPLISDLIAQESDWPGSKQVAARLRMALPPEIQQAESAAGKITSEQQAQMAMSQVKQLSEQLKLLNAHAQQVEIELKNTEEENKLLKQKSAIELTKAANDMEIKQNQLQLDEMIAVAEYKIRTAELELQERAMKINEAKLAITGVEVAHDMAKDLYDKEMITKIA